MPRRKAGPGRFVELAPFAPAGFRARPVRAYVPATYDPSVPAPLLVVFDGQNVFGDEGSYAGGWHTHEAVDRLAGVGRGQTAPVVVAIENGGAERIREMGSEVRGFAEDVATVLLPRIQLEFNVQGPEGRAVNGASLGGLAALFAHLDHPEAFGSAIAMSPSLWFAQRRYFKTLAEAPIAPTSRLYIDAGRRESARMYDDAQELASILQRRGHPSLMWRPDAKGAHHERSWRRRLPKALRFAFGKPPRT